MRFLLCLCLSFSLNAIPFFVQGFDGEVVSFEVDGQETLAEIQEQIESYFALPSEYQSILVTVEGPVEKKVSSNSKQRNYDTPVTPREKQDIAYIVNTLAEKSMFSLIGYKASLEEAGDRVGHVHPLRFLMCIFTDSKLRSNIKEIKKRGGMIWGDFMKGLKGSLSEESKRGNITDHQIVNFSKAVGIDSDSLIPLAQKKEWTDFVTTLIKNAKGHE